MLAHFSSSKTIVAEPISPENFAKFGGVISSSHQLSTVQASSANYGTAIKLFKVSPIEKNSADATANFNLFRCSPPLHLIDDHRNEDEGLTYTMNVLERHPLSSQTFIPMGRSRNEVSYMVIVAPSDPNSPQSLPLIDQSEAFVVRGDQAVTYGVGTWHAPMIALGDITDFAVLIHETGDNSRDTEEVSIESMKVEFSVSPLLETRNSENERTAQSNEEFEKQRQEYHAQGPPLVSVNGAVGNESFDKKQIKYAVEREYYARNYAKVIELVDSSPVENQKLNTELQCLKLRASDKL